MPSIKGRVFCYVCERWEWKRDFEKNSLNKRVFHCFFFVYIHIFVIALCVNKYIITQSLFIGELAISFYYTYIHAIIWQAWKTWYQYPVLSPFTTTPSVVNIWNILEKSLQSTFKKSFLFHKNEYCSPISTVFPRFAEFWYQKQKYIKIN